MLPGPPRRRPARPVAVASIDVLVDGAEDLAKGWLLALLERAPLEEAPRILAGDLHREGPRLCTAVVRALGSDADQQRLEPGGALVPLAARAGELGGAAGPGGAAQAVDALQEVIWSALRRELRDPDADLIAQLAERLAQITALVRAAALQAPAAGPRGPGLSAVPGEDTEPYRAPPPPGRGAPSPPPGSTPPAPLVSSAAPPPPVSRPEEPRLRAWMDTPSAESEPTPLWVGALGEEIGRAGSGPLSLLLAELEDADRVLAVESDAGSAATFGAFAQGVRQAVRRQDILVCETASRAWVIARDTGRSGAQALGERISSAVQEGRPWRGAPMAASVGVAVLGEDGQSPAALIEAAEEDRFAASARGGV
jgi:hypothetical protein